MDKLGCARVDVGVPTTATSADTPDAKPSASGDNKSGEANLLKITREYCDKAGKVPAALSSPVAGALYLAANNSQLVGKSESEKASVLQQLLNTENELRHHVAGWVNPTQVSVEGCNPGTVAKSKDATLR